MNEEKFTDIADMYTKFRPPYPETFLKYLYSEVGVSKESTIADIGSGTGIFTETLLRRGSTVFSIEPNDSMRKVAEENLTGFKKYTSIKATAENTTLYSSSVDFITVAQAFHWFDKLRFKSECRKILKAEGKIILVWNIRDTSTELMLETAEVNRRYCPNFKGFSDGMNIEDPNEFLDFFNSNTCKVKTFQNDLTYNEDEFIGRNLSSSYSLTNMDKNYYMYINTLKSVFKKYNKNGYVYIPNVSTSYIGKVHPVI